MRGNRNLPFDSRGVHSQLVYRETFADLCDIDALYDKQVLAQFSFASLRGSASSAYQAGSPVAMRLSMSRKAFSIASLWYISYMS